MKVVTLFNILILAGLSATAAEYASREPQRPIYRITVIAHSITAVNYGHRTDPTKIDFAGTVLSPKSHGAAIVESRTGAVKIHAKFENLGAPSRFGRQFLTYVLWAISPEGRSMNLGEIVTNSRGNGTLDVTSSLQAFALMATAEPYYSVTLPSGLVVLENELRSDTRGTVERVEAKYELLPRDAEYTLSLGGPEATALPPARVSASEHNALVAIYQAQNAIQIARSMGAERFAPDVLTSAEGLLAQAQSMDTPKGNKKQIVTIAREAAQKAEDARLIAVKKKAGVPGHARWAR